MLKIARSTQPGTILLPLAVREKWGMAEATLPIMLLAAGKHKNMQHSGAAKWTWVQIFRSCMHVAHVHLEWDPQA